MDKTEYHIWMLNKINELAKRDNLAVRNVKSNKMIPVSWIRIEHYKEILKEVLGNSCSICSHVGRLELAHIYYEKDSITTATKGAHRLMRAIEALKYPERFIHLCSVCHGVFDHADRNGGKDFLNKIEKLLICRNKKNNKHEL